VRSFLVDDDTLGLPVFPRGERGRPERVKGSTCFTLPFGLSHDGDFDDAFSSRAREANADLINLFETCSFSGFNDGNSIIMVLLFDRGLFVAPAIVVSFSMARDANADLSISLDGEDGLVGILIGEETRAGLFGLASNVSEKRSAQTDEADPCVVGSKV